MPGLRRGSYSWKYEDLWKPGPNILLWYDFENDSGTTINNKISGGMNSISSSNLNISTLSTGKKIATFNTTTNAGWYTNGTPSFNVRNFSFAGRVKINTAPYTDAVVFNNIWWSARSGSAQFVLGPYNDYNRIQFGLYNGGESGILALNRPNMIPNCNDGKWHCYICISTASYSKFIMDGGTILTGTPSSNSSNNGPLYMSFRPDHSSGTVNMSYGEFIIDNDTREEDYAIKYYKFTKNRYLV